MIDNFELWQQSECARLGCTIEQHNRLLEIAGNLESAGIGGGYYHITSIITQPKTLRDLGVKTSKLELKNDIRHTDSTSTKRGVIKRRK